MTEQDIKAIVDESVARHLEPLLGDVHSIARTLQGAPSEGNKGVLTRMERTERRVAFLIWSIPVWVTGGTGLGQVLIKWWGVT